MEFLLLVVLHFIPTIIAFCRDHNSKFGILAMNLLLGWTGIFWIWALIWSLCNPNSNSVTVINNNNLNWCKMLYQTILLHITQREREQLV